jgi:hypothetical protein
MIMNNLKQYVKPETDITESTYTGFLCASTIRAVRFGNATDEHGTAGWVNEGYSGEDVVDGRTEGGQVIGIDDDTDFDLDSRSKSGSFWDE